MIRTVLAAGAIVSTTLMPAVRASATPQMMAAGREPQRLQRQVVRLFDELDRVGQDLDVRGLRSLGLNADSRHRAAARWPIAGAASIRAAGYADGSRSKAATVEKRHIG